MSDGSGLLLYCITSAAAPPPALAFGLAGLRLYAVKEAALAALVSPLPSKGILTQPELSDILSFERALSAAHAAGDVLPARYGSVIESEQVLRAHLKERQAEYVQALLRVQGCVELGIRAELPENSPPPDPTPPADHPKSGLLYLKARQAHHAREAATKELLSQVASRVRADFSDLARESQAQEPRSAQAKAAITISFLVPKEQLSPFQTRFSSYSLTGAQRLFLVGPWPPFSFTMEGGSDGLTGSFTKP